MCPSESACGPFVLRLLPRRVTLAPVIAASVGSSTTPETLKTASGVVDPCSMRLEEFAGRRQPSPTIRMSNPRMDTVLSARRMFRFCSHKEAKLAVWSSRCPYRANSSGNPQLAVSVYWRVCSTSILPGSTVPEVAAKILRRSTISLLPHICSNSVTRFT